MNQALSRLVGGGGVVVVSGAGLSTQSGIPDYRGATGVRRRAAPMTYRDFIDRSEGRRLYWARSHVGWTQIDRAAPNPGHLAAAALEQAGLVDGVITQNVDGLHQAAGSRAVIELHGSLAETVCLACGERRSRLELHHRLEAANPSFARSTAAIAPDGDADLPDPLVASFVVVDCLVCGGALKPDVVFFGENVPRPRVEAAFSWVEGARSLLVLGSSLSVMSGYRFVMRAHRNGTPVAIVNQGPTRGDALASIRVDGELCDTLSALVPATRGGRPWLVSTPN